MRENACHYARWRFTKRPVLPRGKTNEIKGGVHKVENRYNRPGPRWEESNSRMCVSSPLLYDLPGAPSLYSLPVSSFVTFPFPFLDLHYNATKFRPRGVGLQRRIYHGDEKPTFYFLLLSNFLLLFVLTKRGAKDRLPGCIPAWSFGAIQLNAGRRRAQMIGDWQMGRHGIACMQGPLRYVARHASLLFAIRGGKGGWSDK